MASQTQSRSEGPTEARNPRTTDIDRVATLDMLSLLNAEDALVPAAVAAVLPDLAHVVDAAVTRIRSGGRVHYFGAGTSGRIAIMDAAELIPTFGVAADLVVAHHAGGSGALERPREAAEDDEEQGLRDAAEVEAADLVVCLSASGRTPYVGGALRGARERGAFTVLMSSNPDAELAPLADIHLQVDTGPEAIAGSTRLKAATAQKIMLNSLSTVIMIRCGKTWSNLMVDVVAKNSKLRQRQVRILLEATGETRDRCVATLAEADGDLKTALVAILSDHPVPVATSMLYGNGGNVRAAISSLSSDGAPTVVR